MRISFSIDGELVRKAKELGKHRTKSEDFNAALTEYVKHLGRLKILDFVGNIDFDPRYDYKAERRKR